MKKNENFRAEHFLDEGGGGDISFLSLQGEEGMEVNFNKYDAASGLFLCAFMNRFWKSFC